MECEKEMLGSSLLSDGVHTLDILLFLMGNEVESVHSLATFSENEDFVKYEYLTTSVSIIKFDDGRIGKASSVIDCL